MKNRYQFPFFNYILIAVFVRRLMGLLNVFDIEDIS